MLPRKIINRSNTNMRKRNKKERDCKNKTNK